MNTAPADERNVWKTHSLTELHLTYVIREL